MYSDDQWLRWYAHADSGVSGVWTQVILKHCLEQQSVNESLYQKSVIQLAANGYTYTVIDADILMASAKLAAWKIQPVYTAALKALANEKNTNLGYVISVSADFIKKLYLEVIVTEIHWLEPREPLVLELLRVLVKRSKIDFIRKLKSALSQRFELIPLKEKEVFLVLDTWLASQQIIT